MQRISKLTALLVFVIFVLFSLTGCETVDQALLGASNALSSPDPVTGKREILLMSESAEVTRGDKAVADVLGKARTEGIPTDKETLYYDRALTVFNRLLPVVHRQHLPWELHVLQDDNWNAFTPGGGKVFVLTGIFEGNEALQSDDELAAVIAHEMAHVAARHASEKSGKVMVTTVADSSLKTDDFAAAFNTNQEDEADRIAAMYMALAGFNPEAATSVWRRMDKALGSYSTRLHTHPLNDDRANNVFSYAQKALPYYQPGVQHENYLAVLADNPLFSNPALLNDATDEPETAEAEAEPEDESGLVAFTEMLTNAYIEAQQAKIEQSKREAKRYQQAREAARVLQIGNLTIAPVQGGGKGIFGISMNTADRDIKQAIVRIRYWNGQAVVHEKVIPWKPLASQERFDFGIKLDHIKFTGITVTPDYVLLVGDQAENQPENDKETSL